MDFGRRNIIAGCIVIFIGAAGGMALGFTIDAYFARGYYEMPLTRLLVKAGHTHGMPFALYNLIYGGLIDRMALDDRWKRRGSILAMLAFIMPVGLLLRGLDDASMRFVPVVMVGALCFLASVAVLLKGALSLGKNDASGR